MNRKMKLGMFLSFAGLFCLFGLNVYADMYIESKTTNYTIIQQAGVEDLEKTYVTADKMKTVQSDGEITIVRLDKGLMWNINGSRKTYMEMSFEEMKAATQKAMNAMEDTIANIPPEQRKQMEQFMPQFIMPKKPELKIKRTGKEKDISGYKCEFIIATMDTSRTEMWVTKQIEYDKDAKKFFESMSSVFSDIVPFYNEASVYQSLIKLELFPIETKTITTMGYKRQSPVSTVSEVDYKKINDSEFELPGGLKKVEAKGAP